jgi:folate-binding Fe-S cluster repair protein YgfZ
MSEQLLTVTELKERFVDVSEVMQADIKKLIQHQLNNKCQAILKKIYAKNPDAKVSIDYTIIKNKQGKYESDFVFIADGERFVTSSHQGFKVATDLVSHAFDKWKRTILGLFGWKKLFK